MKELIAASVGHACNNACTATVTVAAIAASTTAAVAAVAAVAVRTRVKIFECKTCLVHWGKRKGI